MVSDNQPDLFQDDDQIRPVRRGCADARCTGPTPDTVAAASSTKFSPKPAPRRSSPRDAEDAFRLYRTIFPQMTNWLPDEEGARLRFEFETEIRRLEAA